MANQIIHRGAIVSDSWQRVDAEASLPDGDVIVPLARWESDREALLAHAQAGHKIGVLIDGTHDVRALKADLPHFHTIAVEFPSFADGRGYSHARILRDQLGYEGELRAVGDVLRDQIFYMHRVGFETFETAPGLSLESALKGLEDFSVTYQAAADDARPLFRRVNDRRQPAG